MKITECKNKSKIITKKELKELCNNLANDPWLRTVINAIKND